MRLSFSTLVLAASFSLLNLSWAGQERAVQDKKGQDKKGQDKKDQKKEKAQSPPTRLLRFDIDDKAAPHQFLPPPPKTAPLKKLITDDLGRVPEIQFQEFIIAAKDGWDELREPESKADIELARRMAKINVLNARKTDLFLETLLEHRPDLAGLPFVMGDAARVKKSERVDFKSEMEWVGLNKGSTSVPKSSVPFWRELPGRLKDKGPEGKGRFTIAALMQILGPETSYHAKLVKRLAAVEKPYEDYATEGLARLAVFSTDKEVRQAAVKALQNRPAEPATAVLLKGLRYPWPSVARQSAEAVIQLKRGDLVAELVKLLEEPDPRAPVFSNIKGQQVPVVRELVRINHHSNCLLCHPPGNTQDVLKPSVGEWKEVEKGVQSISTHNPGFDREIVFDGVPTPGQRFPKRPKGNLGDSYDNPLTDRVVRVDVTYLRQDFSLLHKVANAAPWPETQRFDYVVRRRVLSESEAQLFRKAFASEDRQSPYRQAALEALRRLTGKDAGTTAEQWRKALSL